MVSINYSAREVCCKIVYYGPGLSGKTTNLQYVHAKVPQNTRGKLISLATEADRTLYFDFLPINIGTINGFTAKFQLYTVPGQVYYNATRKLVLRGVDGVVFVADSQPDKMDENIESLTNLEENLLEYGYDLSELPMVIQYNKRDLPGVLPVEVLNARLNPRRLPSFEASATIGNGVFDTLKLVIRIVLEKAKTAQGQKPVATAAAPPARAVPVAEQVVEEVPEYPSVRSVAPPVHTPPVTEPIREPVYAAPFPKPAVSPEPVYQQAPVAQAAPQVSATTHASMRPYPGSRSGSIVEQTQTPPAHRSSRQNEFSGQDPEENITESPMGVQERTRAGMVSPHMAPSMRRRSETKKRGFFKRLFGVK